jgi:hypothetical protein
MTKTETARVLAYLGEAFPTYRDRGIDDHAATISVWHDIFQSLTVDQVMDAVRECVRRAPMRFAPNASEIYAVAKGQHIDLDKLLPMDTDPGKCRHGLCDGSGLTFVIHKPDGRSTEYEYGVKCPCAFDKKIARAQASGDIGKVIALSAEQRNAEITWHKWCDPIDGKDAAQEGEAR